MQFSLIALIAALAGATMASPMSPHAASNCDVACKFRACSSLMLALKCLTDCTGALSTDVDKCQFNGLLITSE